MGYAIDKIVAWAASQIGYKESGTNITKYAADMDKNYPDFFNTKKQGAEWCGVFVCDGFCTNFGETKALKALHLPKHNAAAGCKYAANYYRSAKAFYASPKVGDQIFFGTKGNESHTGLVVGVSSNYVTTIEGNKSNQVKKCSYKIGASNIAGYGRPNYSVIPEPAPEPTPTPGGNTVMVELSILKEGSKGEQVKTVQRILKELGFKDAKGKVLAIDGSYGPATTYAVKSFQKKSGLSVDGITGQKTWNKLLKG